MSHDDDNVGVDELAALAKQLDLHAPDEQRVELMRSSLLRAAGEDRRAPRARWPFVAGGFTAGALAAAAAAMVVLHVGHAETLAVAPHEGSAMEQRAQIEASSAADFERTVTHGAKGNDEVVRLHAGRISLAVADLPSGDRVRVAANNGEIEGSGLYEVAVVDDAIREVKVKEGSARVRLVGSQEVFLATGQVWKAPLITADVAPAKPAREEPRLIRTPTPVAPTRPVQPPAAPSVPALQTMTSETPEPPPQAISQIAKADPKPATALEQHFAAGWSLLRANKPGEAARELAAAAEAGGDDPLAGDARYFEAIALTKAGRKTEAEHALLEFMDRSPHAVRRGRAAVMLGRLIAERGDSTAARPWFESASHDPDPNVAAAAAAGLTSLK